MGNDLNAEERLAKAVAAVSDDSARLKPINIDRKEVDKFLTYGTKTFGRIGYNPYQNNAKVWKKELTDSEEWNHTLTGAGKLASIGFKDTFGFGVFGDTDNAKKYADINEKYSSTKGGLAHSIVLSAGYTAGIIGAVAAEELLTMGTSTALGIGKGLKAIKTFQELGNVENATSFLAKTYDAENFVGKMARTLNPLENTTDFIRQVKNNTEAYKAATALTKVGKGVGGLVKDARKIYMSHSESKLESDMARNEFFEKAVSDWHKKNPDQDLSNEDLNIIGKKADEVASNVYQKNLGLIYATNAIVFDDMFKNARRVREVSSRFGSFAREGGRVVSTMQANHIKNFLYRKAWRPIKDAVTTTKGLRALGDWALSSSMEGFQEVGQDMISGAEQKFGLQELQQRGNFFKDMLDVPSKADAYLDEFGNMKLDTFLSGMLMGVVASPVGMATGVVSNMAFNKEYRQNLYQPLFKHGQWKKNYQSQYEKAQEEAKAMTEFFNNTQNYSDIHDTPMFQQAGLQEEINTAIQNGDKKAEQDARAKSNAIGIHSMLRNNADDLFVEHLQYMRDNLSTEQLNDAFGTSYTQEESGLHKEKINKMIDQTKQMRKDYNVIQQIQNPYTQLLGDDKLSIEQKLDAIHKHTAFENLKKDMLFMHASINDKAARLKTLQEKIHNAYGLNALDANTLMHNDDLNQEISLLETKVKASKEIYDSLDETSKNQYDKDAKLLESLKEYKEATHQLGLTEKSSYVKNDLGANIIKQTAYKKALNAYAKYLSIKTGKSITPEMVNDDFADLVDYKQMMQERNDLSDYVKMVSAPEYFNQALDRYVENQKHIDKNKQQHIQKSLEAFYENEAGQNILDNLIAEGMFFDIKELDDLIQKGIMPSKILYAKDQTEVSKEDYHRAVAIIENHYKVLTGKKLAGKNVSLISRRYTRDNRTFGSFLVEHNLPLGESVSADNVLTALEDDALMTPEQKEVLAKVRDTNATVTFKGNQEQPISVTEDGIVVDLSYAEKSFEEGDRINIDGLVLAGIVEFEVAKKLSDNETLAKDVDMLMERAKKQLPDNVKSQYKNAFKSREAFISHALNSNAFQQELASVEDPASVEEESIWDSLWSVIKDILKEIGIKSNLLKNTINLSSKILNDGKINNITSTTNDNPSPDSGSTTDEKTTIPPIAEYDEDGNIIVTLTTPFEELPDTVKNEYAKMFKVKHYSELSQEQIDTIQDWMQHTPAWQKPIIDYNLKVNGVPPVNTNQQSDDTDNNFEVTVEFFDSLFPGEQFAGLSDTTKLKIASMIVSKELDQSNVLEYIAKLELKKQEQEKNNEVYRLRNKNLRMIMRPGTIQYISTLKNGKDKKHSFTLTKMEKLLLLRFYPHILELTDPTQIAIELHNLKKRINKKTNDFQLPEGLTTAEMIKHATDYLAIQEKNKNLYAITVKRVNAELLAKGSDSIIKVYPSSSIQLFLSEKYQPKKRTTKKQSNSLDSKLTEALSLAEKHNDGDLYIAATVMRFFDKMSSEDIIEFTKQHNREFDTITEKIFNALYLEERHWIQDAHSFIEHWILSDMDSFDVKPMKSHFLSLFNSALDQYKPNDINENDIDGILAQIIGMYEQREGKTDVIDRAFDILDGKITDRDMVPEELKDLFDFVTFNKSQFETINQEPPVDLQTEEEEEDIQEEEPEYQEQSEDVRKEFSKEWELFHRSRMHQPKVGSDSISFTHSRVLQRKIVMLMTVNPAQAIYFLGKSFLPEYDLTSTEAQRSAELNNILSTIRKEITLSKLYIPFKTQKNEVYYFEKINGKLLLSNNKGYQLDLSDSLSAGQQEEFYKIISNNKGLLTPGTVIENKEVDVNASQNTNQLNDSILNFLTNLDALKVDTSVDVNKEIIEELKKCT